MQFLEINGYILSSPFYIHPQCDEVLSKSELKKYPFYTYQALEGMAFQTINRGEIKSIIRVVFDDFQFNLEMENRDLVFYPRPEFTSLKSSSFIPSIDRKASEQIRRENLKILKSAIPPKSFIPDLYF